MATDDVATSPDDLLSTGEAAEVMGVTHSHVRRVIGAGELAATRLGKRSWQVRRADAEAWRDVQRRPGPKTGTTPSRWFDQACWLLDSARIMQASAHGEMTKTVRAILETGGRVGNLQSGYADLTLMTHRFRMCAMIAGLALENALKGLILVRGEEPPTKGHALRALVEVTGMADALRGNLHQRAFDDQVLRMEQAIIWSARYPAPLSGPATKVTSSADAHLPIQIAEKACELLAEAIQKPAT